MGKQGTKHRVYTLEFKSEAVALVLKREQPVSQIAVDLGLNENMLRRWVQNAQEAVGTGVRAFPRHGRLRDEELTRLRKENRALKEANELLKKWRSSSRKEIPCDGIPFHEGEPGVVHHQGDGRSMWGKQRSLLHVGTARGIIAEKPGGRRVDLAHSGYCFRASSAVWQPPGAGRTSPSLRQTGKP
jgi:transposase